jgi:hypothetical protein
MAAVFTFCFRTFSYSVSRYHRRTNVCVCVSVCEMSASNWGWAKLCATDGHNCVVFTVVRRHRTQERGSPFGFCGADCVVCVSTVVIGLAAVPHSLFTVPFIASLLNGLTRNTEQPIPKTRHVPTLTYKICAQYGSQPGYSLPFLTYTETVPSDRTGWPPSKSLPCVYHPAA